MTACQDGVQGGHFLSWDLSGPLLPTPLCLGWAGLAGARCVSGLCRLTYQSLAQIQPFGLGRIEKGVAMQLLQEQTERPSDGEQRSPWSYSDRSFSRS